MAVDLSICMATLNRASFIGATLDSIMVQRPDSVEVVIVDGGSIDDTAEIVRRYAVKHGAIRYHRQPTNGGVDRDFDKAVELARGRYCWLLPDDDVLLPGATAAVLRAIRREPSLVVPNAEVRDIDLKTVLQPRRHGVPADRTYGPTEDEQLFGDLADYMSYIGSVVIRRELWLGRDRERYYGSEFVHVGVIFQQPLPDGAVVLSDPTIAIRFDNAQWKPRSFQIWMFKWPDLVWSFERFANPTKERITPRRPWTRLRTLMRYRARGAYSLREYRLWIQPLQGDHLKKLVARIVALSPGVISNLICIVYYRVVYGPSHPFVDELKRSLFHYSHYLARFRSARP